MVQQYHSLLPLEDLQAAAEQLSAAFGVCTALIRAASPLLQGQAVTLRRLDPRQACLASAWASPAYLTLLPCMALPQACMLACRIQRHCLH